jgi:hypothetical protein
MTEPQNKSIDDKCDYLLNNRAAFDAFFEASWKKTIDDIRKPYGIIPLDEFITAYDATIFPPSTVNEFNELMLRVQPRRTGIYYAIKKMFSAFLKIFNERTKQ